MDWKRFCKPSNNDLAGKGIGAAALFSLKPIRKFNEALK
jgi:hypothetical protein